MPASSILVLKSIACLSACPFVCDCLSIVLKIIVGGVDGGSPCRMSIKRNGNVALSNLRKGCGALSILKSGHRDIQTFVFISIRTLVAMSK